MERFGKILFIYKNYLNKKDLPQFLSLIKQLSTFSCSRPSCFTNFSSSDLPSHGGICLSLFPVASTKWGRPEMRSFLTKSSNSVAVRLAVSLKREHKNYKLDKSLTSFITIKKKKCKQIKKCWSRPSAQKGN